MENLHSVSIDETGIAESFWQERGNARVLGAISEGIEHLPDSAERTAFSLNIGSGRPSIDDAILGLYNDLAQEELARLASKGSGSEALEELIELTAVNGPVRTALREKTTRRVIDQLFLESHPDIANKIRLGLAEGNDAFLSTIGLTRSQVESEESFAKHFQVDYAINNQGVRDVAGEHLGRLEGFVQQKKKFLREQKRIANFAAIVDGQHFETMVTKHRLSDALAEVARFSKEADVPYQATGLAPCVKEYAENAKRAAMETFIPSSNASKLSQIVAKINRLGGSLGGGASCVAVGAYVYNGLKASKGERKEVDLSQVKTTRRSSSVAH